jgi:hypothetical protein
MTQGVILITVSAVFAERKSPGKQLAAVRPQFSKYTAAGFVPAKNRFRCNRIGFLAFIRMALKDRAYEGGTYDYLQSHTYSTT